jgi:hypothetical protein
VLFSHRNIGRALEIGGLELEKLWGAFAYFRRAARSTTSDDLQSNIQVSVSLRNPISGVPGGQKSKIFGGAPGHIEYLNILIFLNHSINAQKSTLWASVPPTSRGG